MSTRLSEADEMRAQMRLMRIPEHAIERAIVKAQADGLVERPLTPTVDEDDDRIEKAIEHEADKQLRALGFEVVKFSHPGRTKQTPGIADRRYYHRSRRLAFWWEAKSPTGRQRPDQKLFQEMCDAVGDLYVLGTDQDLFTWLVARGIAAHVEGGLLIALPYDRTQGAA